MKDGVILQVDTPEEIVTAPKHEYVARFVADISRLNVISARRVMQPVERFMARGDRAGPDLARLPRVGEHDTLGALIEIAAQSADPLAVSDRDGNIVGIVDRQSLLEGLRKGGGA
jgi:glycine betaine/proline transport system ATP-binding protein